MQQKGGCSREIILKAAELLCKRKQELGGLVTREMGKVLPEGLGDVQEAIDMAYYMGSEGRRLAGETVPSELANKDCKSVRVPIGVFALITPWNFPLAIPAWKLFPALVSGNTVVFKPSSYTPVCATKLVEILVEAGIPDGVLNLVHGTGDGIGEYLATHPKIDGVSFTGSTSVGEKLSRICSAFDEEIFGPVRSVMSAKNLEDAIRIVNDVKYGLSSAIYRQDVNNAAIAERDLDTGLVYINASTIGAEIQLPFGGTKKSGLGHREAGGKGGAIDMFTKWKVIFRDYSGRLQKAPVG